MRLLKNQWCERLLSVAVYVLVLTYADIALGQEDTEDKGPAVPVIKKGETQIVKRFEDPDMWVETEFDSDGDGKLDRMHVDVTRQRLDGHRGTQDPGDLRRVIIADNM